MRVGDCGQLSMESECSCWQRSVPLGSGGCETSQDGSWALKSPAIIAFGIVFKWSSCSEKEG